MISVEISGADLTSIGTFSNVDYSVVIEISVFCSFSNISHGFCSFSKISYGFCNFSNITHGFCSFSNIFMASATFLTFLMVSASLIIVPTAYLVKRLDDKIKPCQNK
jgi:hypothetical protein